MKLIKNTFILLGSVGIGFVILILFIGIFTWLFGLLEENFIPKSLLEKSAFRSFGFVVIMSLSALFSGISVGYLYGKDGAKISLAVFLLFLPFFIFSIYWRHLPILMDISRSAEHFSIQSYFFQ